MNQMFGMLGGASQIMSVFSNFDKNGDGQV